MKNGKCELSLNWLYETAILNIMKHLEVYDQVLCTMVNCSDL